MRLHWHAMHMPSNVDVAQWRAPCLLVILVQLQTSILSLTQVCNHVYIATFYLTHTHIYMRIYIILILRSCLSSACCFLFIFLLLESRNPWLIQIALTKTVVGTKGRRFVSTFLVVDLLSDHFHGRSVKNFCGLCFITSSSVSRPQPHLPSLANYGLNLYKLII